MKLTEPREVTAWNPCRYLGLFLQSLSCPGEFGVDRSFLDVRNLKGLYPDFRFYKLASFFFSFFFFFVCLEFWSLKISCFFLFFFKCVFV